MKKILSLVLSLALLCGISQSAAAVDSKEARLTHVTQKVKQILSISDAYDSFYGELQEDTFAPYWTLTWGSEDSDLNISATENGKVMSYSYNELSKNAYSGTFPPSFPKTTRDEALSTVNAFLDKVLAQGTERAAFDTDNTSEQPSTINYYFSGTILLNGLPSPHHFSITVRASDNEVTRFRRDDLNSHFTGGVPSANAKATKDQAANVLKDTLSLKLEYVTSDDGKTAVLRYLPIPNDKFYVDGQSGKLVNFTELCASLSSDAENFNYAMDTGGSSTTRPSFTPAPDLSTAEQAGVDKLVGVLTTDALDKKIRAFSALGLGGFTLSSGTYSVDRKTDAVSARLQYVKQEDGASWRRYITVDGKTGALNSIFGSTPYDETHKASLTAQEAQAKAEAFLKELWGTTYAKTARYTQNAELTQGHYNFTYAQKVNGYFYGDNVLSISIDAIDGTVCALSRSFDESITFAHADGIITADAAASTWFSTYAPVLRYLAVPQALDPSAPEVKPLIDIGYHYINALTLGYTLSREGSFSGIDAKTGTPVMQSVPLSTGFAYDDLDGVWGKTQMEVLASYGIGYPGGSFQPKTDLTQIDFLILLASSLGYQYDLTVENAADDLYRFAYSAGLITKAQRQDSKTLSRAETVKLLLDSTGYGEIAGFQGIFTCTFSDEASIPAAYYGYAALAQGMGMVNGDKSGAFVPNRTATRIEAALMLYQFMNR